MAPRNQPTTASKPKKKRNRKARTEVSSSSSSSSEEISSSSDSDTKASTQELTKSTKEPPRTNTTVSQSKASPPSAIDRASPAQEPAAQEGKRESESEAFESWYLKQATKEFADDLEKLRTASDWKGQRSVDVLVGALRQGAGGALGEGRGRE